jgi:hypothetical protein
VIKKHESCSVNMSFLYNKLGSTEKGIVNYLTGVNRRDPSQAPGS